MFSYELIPIFLQWLFLWMVFLGLPNYAFKKWKFTYHERPYLHVLWYIFGIAIWAVVYLPYLQQYFFEDTTKTFLALMLSIPILIIMPRYYQRDFFNNQERANYAFTKYFEILCQQVGFLCGVLTFGVTPIVFGLIFFATHTFLIFFIPKKDAFIFTGASLFGGVIFSLLHSWGPIGFFLAFFLHRFFYIALHYFHTQKGRDALAVHRR